MIDYKDENKRLKARNEFLQRMVNGLKIHNQQLTEERNHYCEKLNRIQALGVGQ